MTYRSRDVLGSEMALRERVSQALGQIAGDVPAATRLVIESGREALEQHGQAWRDSYVARVKAQAQQRALPDRASLLLTKAEELRSEVQPLLEDGEHEEKLTRARRRLHFAQFGDDADLVRECRIEWAVLEVQREVQPLQASVILQAADELSSLAGLADEDLQAALRVCSLLQERLDSSEDTSSSAQLGVEWGEDRTASEQHAARVVRKHLRLPIGELAAKSPAGIADDVVAQVKRGVLNPPGIGDSLPPQEASALLGSIPTWAGTNRGERLLWDLQTPRAVIRKPASVPLPTGLPSGCSVTIEEGDGFTFLVRVFKVVPIPLITGFDAALRNGEVARGSCGGVLANSAEPWKEADHRALVERFNAIRNRWRGDGNGHVESAPEDLLGLREVVHDASGTGASV